MVPSASMLISVIWPADEPFWVFDDVAEGEAKPVRFAAPVASTMSQTMVLAAAPFAQAGDVIVTSAGAPPLTPVAGSRRPEASKASAPVESGVRVPGVPPTTSSPATSTE